jgi:hypothetical protein
MNATLAKPVVGVQRDTHATKTLPTGAVVEFSSDLHNGRVDVDWKGLCFSVYREDLLDAFSVHDVGRLGSF